MIDISGYEVTVLNNLDKDNINKIVEFFLSNGCGITNELLESYLDLFTFDYDDFVIRFNILNKKYNNNLIAEIDNNMNILEEFYTVI